MMKPMQGSCAVLLLLAAVITARSHPFSLRRSSRELPEDCQNALIVCAMPAILPYVGLNETQIQDRITDTPLSEHCSDWTSAGECVRQAILEGECSEVDDTTASQFANGLEAYDFVSNYICKENFDKISRNFRCLTGRELAKKLKSSCEPNEDEDDKCAIINEIIECTSGVVEGECGEEAASVSNDFALKFIEKFDEFVLGEDCSTTVRTDRLALFKKFLAGM